MNSINTNGIGPTQPSRRVDLKKLNQANSSTKHTAESFFKSLGDYSSLVTVKYNPTKGGQSLKTKKIGAQILSEKKVNYDEVYDKKDKERSKARFKSFSLEPELEAAKTDIMINQKDFKKMYGGRDVLVDNLIDYQGQVHGKYEQLVQSGAKIGDRMDWVMQVTEAETKDFDIAKTVLQKRVMQEFRNEIRELAPWKHEDKNDEVKLARYIEFLDLNPDLFEKIEKLIDEKIVNNENGSLDTFREFLNVCCSVQSRSRLRFLTPEQEKKLVKCLEKFQSCADTFKVKGVENNFLHDLKKDAIKEAFARMGEITFNPRATVTRPPDRQGHSPRDRIEVGPIKMVVYGDPSTTKMFIKEMRNVIDHAMKTGEIFGNYEILRILLKIHEKMCSKGETGSLAFDIYIAGKRGLEQVSGNSGEFVTSGAGPLLGAPHGRIPPDSAIGPKAKYEGFSSSVIVETPKIETEQEIKEREWNKGHDDLVKAYTGEKTLEGKIKFVEELIAREGLEGEIVTDEFKNRLAEDFKASLGTDIENLSLKSCKAFIDQNSSICKTMQEMVDKGVVVPGDRLSKLFGRFLTRCCELQTTIDRVDLFSGEEKEQFLKCLDIFKYQINSKALYEYGKFRPEVAFAAYEDTEVYPETKPVAAKMKYVVELMNEPELVRQLCNDLNNAFGKITNAEELISFIKNEHLNFEHIIDLRTNPDLKLELEPFLKKCYKDRKEIKLLLNEPNKTLFNACIEPYRKSKSVKKVLTDVLKSYPETMPVAARMEYVVGHMNEPVLVRRLSEDLKEIFANIANASVENLEEIIKFYNLDFEHILKLNDDPTLKSVLEPFLRECSKHQDAIRVLLDKENREDFELCMYEVASENSP